MSRRRKPVRDRHTVGAPRDAVTVRCQECNRRLATLWRSDSDGPWGGPCTDGVWYVPADTIEGTVRRSSVRGVQLKDLDHEDWRSVECRQCGRVWQGRESYLVALVERYAGGDARLGVPISDRAQGGLNASRDWAS